MSVFGIAMVRDEADIIRTTVMHMLGQVDEVLILDNGSTDNTRDYLKLLGTGSPLTVLDDPDPAYYQSQKMTRLAHLAADKGATWVVPFDADEIWYSPFETCIADLLERLAPQWLTVNATLYDHVATAEDDDDPDPIVRLGWRRRKAGELPKVACRCRPDLVIEQGNHGASYVGGATRYDNDLVIRHFPYRSPEQFVSKVRNGAAAYAATDLPDDVGAHWRGYGTILAEQGERVLIDEVFTPWFYSSDPRHDPTLIYDPCPT